jgi:hypothetical protein
MDYLEELRNRCKKDGKETVMKQLNISKTYLNNLLDERKKISKPIQNKIDSIEIFEIPKDYMLWAIVDYLYNKVDIIESKPELKNQIVKLIGE